jgi:hypothetical protein
MPTPAAVSSGARSNEEAVVVDDRHRHGPLVFTPPPAAVATFFAVSCVISGP